MTDPRDASTTPRPPRRGRWGRIGVLAGAVALGLAGGCASPVGTVTDLERRLAEERSRDEAPAILVDAAALAADPEVAPAVLARARAVLVRASILAGDPVRAAGGLGGLPDALVAPLTREVALATVADALGGGDAEARLRAARALHDAGRTAPEALVLAALDDPLPEVRRLAVACLGRLPSSPDHLPALRRVLLHDDDERVRGAACARLGDLGSPAAMPLRWALRDRAAGVRAAAARALGDAADQGGPETRTALHVRLAEEDDPVARAAVAWALARHGEVAPLGALIDELEADDAESGPTAAILWLARRAADGRATPERWPEELLASANRTPPGTSPAIPRWLLTAVERAATAPPIATRVAAAGALAPLGARDGVAGERAREALESLAADAEPIVRAAATAALLRSVRDEPDAERARIETALGDASAFVRLEAVDALARRADEDARSTLAALARLGGGPRADDLPWASSVIERAERTLALLGASGDVERLRARARATTQPRHRASILAALVAAGERAAGAELLGVLGERDPIARAQAAAAARHLEPASAAVAIARGLADADPAVRLAAAGAAFRCLTTAPLPVHHGG